MYHELTVWSRGIIMDKEARDVSSCVAAAARALSRMAGSPTDLVMVGHGRGDVREVTMS